GTTLLKLLHHPHSASFRPHAVQNTRSWSNIAQAFTDKKRIRPASAPTIKREEHQTQPSVDAGTSRGRAETARARLTDGTSRRDGPMSFQRAEEIQEVVDVLQHTMMARLRGKPKKGERKKAAEAAKRAGSAPGTSVVDRRSHGHARRVASPRGSVSATSSRGADADRRRAASGASGEQRRRRRRPSTAWHHREIPARFAQAIPAGMPHGSKARPKTAAVMASSFSKSKRSLAEDLGPPRWPPGLIGDGSHKADGKLGMTRARIYSFGASTQGGGGHEEDMLRATAIDTARRSRLPRRCSSAGSAPRDLRPAVPGRRETGEDSVRDDKDRGGGSAAGGYGGVKGRLGNASCRAGADSVHEDSTDRSEHLGVVDISKGDDLSWLLMFFLSPFFRQLTTVLSHAEVSGYIRATGGKHSSFTSGSKPNGGGGGGASMSAICGSPLLADGIANKGTSPTALLDNGGGSGNDEEAPTVPETSSWSGSSSAAESDSGSNDNVTEQRESADRSGSDTRTGTRGRSDRGREVGTRTVAGTAENEGVMPTGSAPPQLDCLRGRYARADRKSKSAYAIKKAAAATAAGAAGASTTAPQTPHTLTSATRCNKRGLFDRSGARDRGGRGGGRGARGPASWRNRLAAVQRRRAVLVDLRRTEATRQVEARAKAEARVPNNASVAASVSVRGARCFTTLEGGAGNNGNATKKNNNNMTININSNRSAPNSASYRAVQAAVTVQRAFRSTLQYEAWLGDQCDRDYLSQVTLRDGDGKRDEPEPSHHQ
ncbi:unnamed protein product, partial [Ectocarpus sp. 8 AP-2014]